MFESLLLEHYCEVCLMEIQAETQAEHNRELQREKMRHEENMATRQAFEAFRDRLLELRMEYLDDPDQAAKKARVLLGSGQCDTILALGGGFREALLAEVARDDWMYEAFVDAQPEEVRIMAVGNRFVRFFIGFSRKVNPGHLSPSSAPITTLGFRCSCATEATWSLIFPF